MTLLVKKTNEHPKTPGDIDSFILSVADLKSAAEVFPEYTTELLQRFLQQTKAFEDRHNAEFTFTKLLKAFPQKQEMLFNYLLNNDNAERFVNIIGGASSLGELAEAYPKMQERLFNYLAAREEQIKRLLMYDERDFARLKVGKNCGQKLISAIIDLAKNKQEKFYEYNIGLLIILAEAFPADNHNPLMGEYLQFRAASALPDEPLNLYQLGCIATYFPQHMDRFFSDITKAITKDVDALIAFARKNPNGICDIYRSSSYGWSVFEFILQNKQALQQQGLFYPLIVQEGRVDYLEYFSLEQRELFRKDVVQEGIDAIIFQGYCSLREWCYHPVHLFVQLMKIYPQHRDDISKIIVERIAGTNNGQDKKKCSSEEFKQMLREFPEHQTTLIHLYFTDSIHVDSDCPEHYLESLCKEVDGVEKEVDSWVARVPNNVPHFVQCYLDKRKKIEEMKAQVAEKQQQKHIRFSQKHLYPALNIFMKLDIVEDNPYIKLYDVAKKFSGLCDFIATLVIEDDLLGEQLKILQSDQENTENIFHQKITIEALNRHAHTHIYDSASLYSKVSTLCTGIFANDVFPNGLRILQHSGSDTGSNERTVDPKQIKQEFDTLPVDAYMKVLTYTTGWTLDVQGHSMVIKKTGENTYGFFDPGGSRDSSGNDDGGFYYDLSVDQLCEQLNKVIARGWSNIAIIKADEPQKCASQNIDEVEESACCGQSLFSFFHRMAPDMTQVMCRTTEPPMARNGDIKPISGCH